MKRTLIATSLLAAAAVTSLSAQTVLINFGLKTYTGTNSPGHVVGGATGTNWFNKAVDGGDITDENGDPTNVYVDFGVTTDTTGTTVDYSANGKAADYNMSAGVSADLKGLFNTNMGTSNAVRGGSGTLGVAVAISGLEPGVYEFYVTMFRGDQTMNSTRDFDVYAGVSNGAITDFSSSYVGTIVNSSDVATWTIGDNYMSGTFTIDGTNDTFSLLSQADDYIGVLTSLEIVAVPEPSTYALWAGVLGLGLVLMRRHCSR